MSVIPVLLGKVDANPTYWLQTTRYLGSEVFRSAIERVLDALCAKAESDDETTEESMLSESLLRLPAHTVEELLTPRWSKLKRFRDLVQVALFLATPGLCALAADAVRDAVKPRNLFLYITTRAQMHLQQRHGVASFQQLEALSPYFEFLEPGDVLQLWYACTERQWFDFRHDFLDGIIRQFPERNNYLPGDVVDVDNLDRSLGGTLMAQHQWIRSQTDKGAERPVVLDALFSWLAAHLGELQAFKVAANVLASEGTRADIVRMQQCVDQFPGAEQVILTAEFNVSQRTLT